MSSILHFETPVDQTGCVHVCMRVCVCVKKLRWDLLHFYFVHTVKSLTRDLHVLSKRDNSDYQQLCVQLQDLIDGENFYVVPRSTHINLNFCYWFPSCSVPLYSLSVMCPTDNRPGAGRNRSV